MGSSFGDLFRISTFGESHGGGVGVIVEGCPPRLDLDVEAIQAELDQKLTPLYDKHMGTMSRLRTLVDMKLANKGEKVKVDTPQQYKKLILKIEAAEDKVAEMQEQAKGKEKPTMYTRDQGEKKGDDEDDLL